MANIKDITIGATYTLSTGTMIGPVTVLAIKGRWVKVEGFGKEMNVAAADLTVIAPEENKLPANGVVKASYRATYITHRVEGVVYVDCGDKVADLLRGMELQEVYEYAAKVLDVPARALAAQYAHLNPGLARMSVGNRVRKALVTNARKA